MDRRPEQAFFQGIYKDGQQTHKNVLNINNHQGNADQNKKKIRYHLIPLRMAINKKIRDNLCLAKEKETLVNSQRDKPAHTHTLYYNQVGFILLM